MWSEPRRRSSRRTAATRSCVASTARSAPRWAAVAARSSPKAEAAPTSRARMVYLVPMDRREITTADFAERWRERIGEIPGAETLTFNYSIGASAGSPVDIRLSHPDPQVLEDAAEQPRGGDAVVPGLGHRQRCLPGKAQLDLTLRPEGRARGLTETELARQIRDAFFGAEAVRQQRGRQELRVYVRRPLDERESEQDLARMVVRTPDGGEMPLMQAADVRRGRAYTTIRRTDGRRNVSVTADVVAGVGNANEIVASLRERELPRLLEDVPGLTYVMGGEQKEQAESLASLRNNQILAFFAMFGLLAIVFKSYAQPLIVMLGAIPFGVTGAFLGHLVMGFDLSMISMMGIVALSGVVVNDSLVLIDAINRFRRDDGMPVWDAVVAAGARRFRPILLTSLTTFMGLAPMILEPSVQARFLVPMAVSLGFGVMFATFILVFLVPSAYLIVEDVVNGSGRLLGKMKWLAPKGAVDPAANLQELHGGE
ncbi:MAG: efflux RND transporter permease subunit [Polyangiales bacterium]